MQYNFDFEIASLFVMLIIVLHFTFVRHFSNKKTRIFGMLLFSCIIECCLNIASSIGLANTGLIPEIVNKALVFVFFVFEGICSYMTFLYFESKVKIEDKYKKIIKWIGTIPLIVFELLVFATPWSGFFYYFEGEKYYQGVGADFGYMYVAYYIFLSMLLILVWRDVAEKRTKMIAVIYVGCAIGAVIMQYRFRGILLTSLANAVMLLMSYLAMQNPNELIDPVTGCGNETALREQMQNRLDEKQETIMITVKVHKFHHINTVLGMENGNMIMREIGHFLWQLCGKYKVFYNGSSAFTVMLDKTDKKQEITELIEKRFLKAWVVQKNHIMLNMHMIVQHYPGDYSTLPEYLGFRNFLLEEAQERGNHVVLVADEGMLRKYQRRLKVEVAVNHAIHEKLFEVYYQPIYSLKEKRIVSLEALVRLKDEELGFIPPDEFIPLAERDGNIIYIGAIVLEECCKFLSKHVLANLSLGIRTIHVNVSMAQCMRQSLTETIAPVLGEYHIPPSMITLEITERTAISTPEQMQIHMQELGDMGVSFAVDDYGSGNSNCSYLVQFPFQEVKIDKEMVWAYFESDVAKSVLENEIRTIKNLGIPVVAEGVEKGEQSEQMERLGVDFIQGYYYGRPMPEKECLRYIRNFNSLPEDYGRNGLLL